MGSHSLLGQKGAVKPLRILHLEDNLIDAELVSAQLEREHLPCVLDRVAERAPFESHLKQNRYDLIISDFSLPGFDGRSALTIAQQLQPETPFIFLSGTIGEECAVESLKQGATDYVLKDRLKRLTSAILRAKQEADAKAELRRRHELLSKQAMLLDEARDAIYVRNLDRVITYWNRGAERIYGWASEEIVGQKSSDILYKTDTRQWEPIWLAVLKDGEWKGELKHVTKSGKEIHVLSHWMLLENLEGAPEGILNINTDITEKKTLQDQLLRTQRLDTLGSLASGIAHDLNNVLAPILMAAELARDRTSDEHSRRMLGVAANSARRGADLVKQILQFAKGDQCEQTTIDLARLANEIARFSRDTFPPSIQIKAVGCDSVVSVLGDRTQLHQVLLNLCVNARDAMPEGGTLSIELTRRILSKRIVAGRPEPLSGPFIELTVQDTGTGIPAATLPKIFEPFFTTKAKECGTGLGLSTVASIVRAHRGFIEVNSTIGQGTAFHVFFPETEREHHPTGAEREQPLPTGNGELILLVDDELALLEMTKEVLVAYGYQVITAADGAEALVQFNANKAKIRLVITDMLMPGLGGRRLMQLIRDRGTEARIMCLTGSAAEDVPASQLGADVLLRKPCPAPILVKTIAQLLNQDESKPAAGARD